MGQIMQSKLGKMGKSVLPRPVIILVTPCYIIICNAFAFTGREPQIIIGDSPSDPCCVRKRTGWGTRITVNARELT